jgi:ADP-heptose:LPS heptosyltransferase
LQKRQNKLVSFGLGSQENYAVLHPFGSTPNQWWSIKNVAPLAKKLYEKHNLRLVLVGKKYDLNGVVVILPPDEIDASVINTTEKLTLPELIAVIDDSTLVITTDSGPFHITGALRKPTIGLFRARRPEHSEHYPTATTILGFDKTCQMKCKWDYCRSNPCSQLSDISVDSVIDKVNQQLK